MSSTTTKIGGAVVVGLLVLLLGLGLGGPGSSEPEPGEEPPPPGPGARPRIFLHLAKGPHYLISAQPDGGEPRSEVSRDQGVQALAAFTKAGGDAWIVVHGDAASGDWESLQLELQAKQIPYYGGPPPIPPEQRS